MKARQYINMMGMAAAVLLSSCVKDTLDGFFRDDDALRNGRKSREKERSVEIPETGGCSRLLPHPPRHFRNCYEQQIKTGTENCSLCLQGSAETVWI